MTTLKIELELEPLERTRVDVVVVPYFAAERPLRRSAGRADWRLCGRLAELVAAGRLAAEPGEAVLIPSGGGLRAPVVMGLGMGPRERFDAARCGDLAAEAVTRARGLGAKALALPFGEFAGEAPRADDLQEGARHLVAGAARAMEGARGRLRLCVVPSDATAAEALRGVQPEALPPGLALELPSAGRPRPARPVPRRLPSRPGAPAVK